MAFVPNINIHARIAFPHLIGFRAGIVSYRSQPAPKLMSKVAVLESDGRVRSVVTVSRIIEYLQRLVTREHPDAGTIPVFKIRSVGGGSFPRHRHLFMRILGKFRRSLIV